jgi:hypothetical protein
MSPALALALAVICAGSFFGLSLLYVLMPMPAEGAT